MNQSENLTDLVLIGIYWSLVFGFPHLRSDSTTFVLGVCPFSAKIEHQLDLFRSPFEPFHHVHSPVMCPR